MLTKLHFMKARLLSILLVFFFSGAAMAANTDSLEAVLKNRNGSEKIATLHLLAKEYSRPDPAKSLKYIQQALQIISDTNAQVYADLCYLAAYNYRSLKQYDSIVVYYQKALKTYQNTGDTLNIMKTSTMYALEYQRRGDFKRASDIQNIGLQLFEPFWETHSEDGNISQSHYATMLSNMSINVESLGYLDSALKYITKTYAIHQNMNASPRKIGYTLVNIGIVYLHMNRNDDAIRYFYDAKEKFTEINDTFNLAKCYNNIGLANKQKGDTVNAIKFYNISLTLNRKINNPEGVVTSLVNLSGLYDNKKYFNKVENFLLEAIKKSKELKMEYIYKDQVGTDILIEIENLENISRVIRAILVVKLPDGRITEWPLRVDLTENKLRYTIQAGDLKDYGKIVAQPYIELDSG